MSSVPFQIYIVSDGSRNTQFYIAGTGTCYIKWKDGDIVTVPLSSTPRSEFRNVGAYSGIIEIYMTDSTSKITSLQTAGYNGSLYFKGVVNFGTRIENIYLYGCANIAYVPNSIPSTLTNLSNLFNSKYDIAGQPVYNSIFADASNSLASWDVSNVTNMSNMFVNAINFNRNISSWNTRKVTDFSYMFNGATSFNNGSAPLTWSLSDVSAINMSYMFQGASSFNQDLSWNTINVTNMQQMFWDAKIFNGNISNWDTRNVNNMYGMFGNNTNPGNNFNKDISNWKTSKVTDMTNVFINATSFNSGAGAGASGPFNWDVGEVKTMQNLFYNCPNFNRDVSNWRPSKVTNMNSMFLNNTRFNQDISGWVVSNVIDFISMFKDASSFNNGRPYYNTNTTKLNWTIRTDANVDMSGMFFNTPFSQDISEWNIRGVTNMTDMFIIGNECGMTSVLFDKILNSWAGQTGRKTNVTFSTIKYTSAGSTALSTLRNSSSWTITTTPTNAAVSYTPTTAYFGVNFTLTYTGAQSILGNNYRLANVNTENYRSNVFAATSNINIYTFNNVNLNNYGMNTLVILNTTNNSIVDILYIDVPPITLEYTTTASSKEIGIFLNGSGPATILWGDNSFNNINDLSGLNQHKHTYAIAGTYKVDISGAGITQLGNGDTAATGIENLTSVLSFGNIPTLTSLAGAFYGASNLTSVPSLLPSTVNNLYYMFYGTKKFNGNISNWDVSKVTNFGYMFQYNNAFNNGQLYYNTNTTKLNWTIRTDANVNMTNMFNNTPFSQDISEWNIRGVTNMTDMFTPQSENECGMTSVLFDKILNSWSKQTGRKTNVTFSTIKYTSAGSSALTTLRETPWTINTTPTTNAVSYTPTTAYYRVNFQLIYTGSVYTSTNVYNLAYASSPTTYIGQATLTSNNTYTFNNVSLNNYGTNNLLILDTTYNSIVDSLYIDVLPSTIITLQYTTAASTEIGIFLTGSGPATILWGDNSSNNIDLVGLYQYKHTYASAGKYTVDISGAGITQLGNGDSAATGIAATGIANLTSVLSFGNIPTLTSLKCAFYGASKLNSVPTSLPSTVTNIANLFHGAHTFNKNLGNWNVSKVTDFTSTFHFAFNFNNGDSYNITESAPLNWTINTDASVNMKLMFYETPFSQDISGWIITKVTNMDNMFSIGTANQPCGMTSTLFNRLLDSWSKQTRSKNVIFDSIRYTDVASSALATLQATPWTMNPKYQVSYTPKSAYYGFSFSLNYSGGPSIPGLVYRLVNVDNPQTFIGDQFIGTGDDITTYTFPNVTLTNLGTNKLLILCTTDYKSIVDSLTIDVKQPITLQYNIDGANTTIGFYLAGSGAAKIKFTSSTNTYETSITELTVNPVQYNTIVANTGTYIANIIGNITIFGGGDTAASGITKLTQVLSFGDMESLVSLSGAFSGATSLTSVPSSIPINVTNLDYMFRDARAFNSPNISLWNVGKVTSMQYMFQMGGISQFNQNLNSWDVSKVTNFQYMFSGGAFTFNNGYTDAFGGALALTWNTSSAINMRDMFTGYAATGNFNQYIGDWNVSKVTDFTNMFRSSTKFNNGAPYYITDSAPLKWTLNESAVVTMPFMFYGSPFSQDISEWNIKNVADMTFIFTIIPAQLTTSPKYRCGMTSTLFNRLFAKWEKQNRRSNTFYQTRYTIDASSALATLKTTWTMNGNYLVSYLPTSADYDVSFSLTYSGGPSDNGSVYRLVNVNSPQVFIGNQFIGTGEGTTTYTFTNVTLKNYGLNNLLILNTTTPSIVDSLTIDVKQSIRLQYDINSTVRTIGIPLAGTGTATISWGDASFNSVTITNNVSETQHTYANDGTYTVNISGDGIRQFGNGGYDSPTNLSPAAGMSRLSSVITFGNLPILSSLAGALFGSNYENNNIRVGIPSTLPSTVRDISFMFRDSYMNDSNISNWDVSGVTSMYRIFYNAEKFNQPLNTWKVGNVKNMYGIFQRAFVFNQNLDSWDVSGVTDFNQMFRNSNFNNGEAYNANAAGTKPLRWNTKSAVNMNGMFYAAANFNQELIDWDVSKVTDFGDMFRDDSFNNGQPYYTTDNKPLIWTFSQVNNINLGGMFYKTPFSQDISIWNIQGVTNMTDMFTPTRDNECGMTSLLFDKLLTLWSSKQVKNNVTFTSTKFITKDAEAAIFKLRDTKNWTIIAAGVTYSPTSVNYGARFNLSYTIALPVTTTAGRVYSLVNINNPTVAISTFTGPPTSQTTYTFNNVVLTDYNYSTLLIIDTTVQSIVDILYINTIFPCFKEGTKILTNNGYIPIEDLRNGDMVKTHIHGYKPIHMIGKRVIYNHARPEREKHQLYKCTSEHFPEVFEDLVITGCHSILVSDFTGPEQRAKSLEVNGDIFITDDKYRLPACVDDRTLVYEKVGPTLIYHIALENDNYFHNYGVYANGLLVETCSKRYLKEWAHMDIVE